MIGRDPERNLEPEKVGAELADAIRLAVAELQGQPQSERRDFWARRRVRVTLERLCPPELHPPPAVEIISWDDGVGFSVALKTQDPWWQAVLESSGCAPRRAPEPLPETS